MLTESEPELGGAVTDWFESRLVLPVSGDSAGGGVKNAAAGTLISCGGAQCSVCAPASGPLTVATLCLRLLSPGSRRGSPTSVASDTRIVGLRSLRRARGRARATARGSANGSSEPSSWVR